MILPCDINELSVVYGNPPTCDGYSRNKFIILISDNHHPPYFWYQLYWTYPCTVKSRVNNTCIKQLDNLILHCLFHVRVKTSLGCGRWIVIVFHESLVLIERWDDPLNIRDFPSNWPFMLVQNTTSLSFCSAVKLYAITTESLDPSSRKAYSKCSGSGFNSSSLGSSNDDFSLP